MRDSILIKPYNIGRQAGTRQHRAKMLDRRWLMAFAIYLRIHPRLLPVSLQSQRPDSRYSRPSLLRRGGCLTQGEAMRFLLAQSIP
jgi:hypothetical protein